MQDIVQFNMESRIGFQSLCTCLISYFHRLLCQGNLRTWEQRWLGNKSQFGKFPFLLRSSGRHKLEPVLNNKVNNHLFSMQTLALKVSRKTTLYLQFLEGTTVDLSVFLGSNRTCSQGKLFDNIQINFFPKVIICVQNVIATRKNKVLKIF